MKRIVLNLSCFGRLKEKKQPCLPFLLSLQGVSSKVRTYYLVVSYYQSYFLRVTATLPLLTEIQVSTSPSPITGHAIASFVPTKDLRHDDVYLQAISQWSYCCDVDRDMTY
jgi:hypothetical protein